MTASPKMDDDEGWALGPEGDADVLAYINQTPALMSLLYDLDLLPEQHPDHETPAWDQIFKITNHWRENSLESRSEVLEAQADVVLHAHTEICDLFAQNSGDYDPSPDEVDRVHDGLTFILGNIAAALKSPRAEPGAQGNDFISPLGRQESQPEFPASAAPEPQFESHKLRAIGEAMSAAYPRGSVDDAAPDVKGMVERLLDKSTHILAVGPEAVGIDTVRLLKNAATLLERLSDPKQDARCRVAYARGLEDAAKVCEQNIYGTDEFQFGSRTCAAAIRAKIKPTRGET